MHIALHVYQFTQERVYSIVALRKHEHMYMLRVRVRPQPGHYMKVLHVSARNPAAPHFRRLSFTTWRLPAPLMQFGDGEHLQYVQVEFNGWAHGCALSFLQPCVVVVFCCMLKRLKHIHIII